MNNTETNVLIASIFTSVISGKSAEVTTQVKAALDAGIAPGKILNDGLVAAMTEVGNRFEQGELYIPEMLVAAKAMQAGVLWLKPYLLASEVRSFGKVVIGTVKGDLHDMGKNLVAMMLEGAGFEVIDLGTDVSPDKFVEAVLREKAQIIAMSALLTTTMVNMKSTIEAAVKANIRGGIKIMVGGAIVTEEYAREIGADGYAPDAIRAVSLTKSLLGGSIPYQQP